jgi:hypothetical protein
MGGDLSVSDTKIGICRIVSEAVFPCATLDLRYTLTAQALIGEESCRGGFSVRTRQDRRECHSIFNRLVCALAKVRQHRVRGVAEKGEPSASPGRQRLAIKKGPSKRHLYMLQQRLDARIPTGELAAKDIGVAGG